MSALLAQFSSVLQANNGLIVALALSAGGLFVLTLLGLILRAAGASLRPIVFIASLFVPIALVFLVGQLVLARAPSTTVVTPAALAIENGQFKDRATLFGADLPATFIRDAKSGLPGILDEAEIAEAGVTLTGETVLIAQFSSAEEASRAAASYHRGFQLHDTSGDETNGWRATRGLQGDYIEMLLSGRNLFVWSGLTREAAATRRAASHLEALLPTLPLATATAALFPALQPLSEFFQPLSRKIFGLLLLVAIYIGWFFRGASWVSGVPPVAGTPPASSDELRSRLMAINDLTVPFVIIVGERPEKLHADWRYADATWLDHARAHGLKRSFRIRLTLDEASHTVRATDYVASFDWSAGGDGANIAWKAASGIIFFQKEQKRVFGLQIDNQGCFKPELSYAYRFDLQEMKAPLMAVITHAGWTWRPTLWHT